MPDGYISGFPDLISVGGADRFQEDLSPDIPRDCFLKQFLKQKMSRKIILVI